MMFKKAFTMLEIVIVLTIIAIIASVTIGISKSKLEKVDSISCYMGYNAMKEIAANIIIQNEYEYSASDIINPKADSGCTASEVYSSELEKCVAKKTAKDLCNQIDKEFNVSARHCDVTAAAMNTLVAGGFKNVTEHIKLSNGLKIYITSDYDKINALSDAVDINDRVGYMVYVDVNGDKGNGQLWSDIMPFYILSSGKVLFLSASDFGISQPITTILMSGNILYDDYSDDKRVVKASQTNLDFKTGVCATRYIRSSSFCGSIQVDTHCTNSESDCRYVINRPVNFFGM